MSPRYRQLPQRVVEAFPVTIHFHGWLTELTRRVRHSSALPSFLLNRRTSVKDLIESFGVPHTEVDAILIDHQPVSFDYTIEEKSSVDIHPPQPPVNVFAPSMLRQKPITAIRFLVDANVGKLAGKLRMAGFDTCYNPQWDDEQLADMAEKRGYILLSRDIQLLKRKKIVFGHFVRETLPARQLSEVIHFYGLFEQMNPFSRCMRCNHTLIPVSKEEVFNRLEPLTQKFYHTFHRCESCGQIYWPGSHRERMERDLKTLTQHLPLQY